MTQVLLGSGIDHAHVCAGLKNSPRLGCMNAAAAYRPFIFLFADGTGSME